jgi:hypothetical protein
MAEFHYAFLKNNRVENIAVFASQDEELADRVAIEQGYDDAVWVGATAPSKWSTYDGTNFTAPTEEYLISIGITKPSVEEVPTTE